MIMLRCTVLCTLLIQRMKQELSKQNTAYNIVQLENDKSYNKKENNFWQYNRQRKQLECRLASREVCHG
jgi:hypothetical protein